VLATDCDRGCPESPDGAAVHAEIHHRIVFKLARGDTGHDVCRQFVDLLSGDEGRHVQRVDAAIRKLRRDAGLGRVVAPAHARVVGVACVSVVAVREFRVHQTDLAEVAALDHGAHVAHQRVAAVAVVHRANTATCLSGAHDVFAFVDRHGHRFFAQHVKTRFEKGFCDFVVRRGPSR